MAKPTKNIILLVLIIIIALIFFLLVKPIPQNPDYHRFADKRTIFGIKNSLNVLTNIPFILVGIIGFSHLIKKYPHNIKNSLPYMLFFIGVVLTGLGSGYYHLNPNNQTLVLDRLAMSVAFMSFFAGFINDYINENLGYYILLPLICAGILSVWYWHITEQIGAGDLRAYIIIQFFPILLIPLIMQLYESFYSHSNIVYIILLFYIAAKIFEFFDRQIFEMVNIISGHSIKHLFAVAGAYLVLKMLILRQKKH